MSPLPQLALARTAAMTSAPTGSRVRENLREGGEHLLQHHALGGPDDAVDVTFEGKAVKRDVAIVRYEEGENRGFTGHVPYHLIASERN